MFDSKLRAYFAALPKIDLHRHLEGAIRIETLLDVALRYGIDLPGYTIEALRPRVQVMPNDGNDAVHFLKKFTTLRTFFRAPDVIRRIAREAVIDAALDNICYLELRFTPRAMARLMNFSYDEVIGWVSEGVRQAQTGCPIGVGLIVSVNRHESLREAERQLRAAVDHRKDGVVGFDLCGQEWDYPAEPFFDLFRQAASAGLGLTLHAGEWAGPRNVRAVIERLGVHRVGHGVRIIEDSSVVRLALEMGTTFEVSITSNVQSGVVYETEHHPVLDMTRLGLKTTFNTDDPSISAITLTDELTLAVERLGMTPAGIHQALIRSAQAAFMPDAERAGLIALFERSMAAADFSTLAADPTG